MRPWLESHSHEIDDTFKDHCIMPGFVDPHLHPSMAAILLPMHFTTAVGWDLPWEHIGPVHDEEQFLTRLVDIDADLAPDEPLFAFGHHPIWHGNVDRSALNELSTTRPIVVWHRGYHSLTVNDACLRWMELDTAAASRHPQIDLDAGKFFETGLSVALRYLRGFILGTERFRSGLDRMRQVIHQGGHTTIGDAALGFYGFEEGVGPPSGGDGTAGHTISGSADALHHGGRRATNEPTRNSSSASWRIHHETRIACGSVTNVKMFADGGFFAELLMLKAPGHLDGRHGEWMTPPERFEEIARVLWNAGLKIHVHCSGDLGVELALSTLEKLQWERPRFNHRFTFEHFGISSSQQVDRMAAVGAVASVNAYYVYELSQAFAANTVGYERASQISRLGSLERAGVPFAVHSDFPMAPAKPLNNAWVAANRLTESGTVMCANERASLDAAIKAITANAAYILGLEEEIGSLRWGKRADFTILEADPYEVGIEALRDIPIWGTVFEGQKFGN